MLRLALAHARTFRPPTAPPMRCALALLLALSLASCDSGEPAVESGPAFRAAVLGSADGRGPFADTLWTTTARYRSPYSLDAAQGLRYRFPDSDGFAYAAFLGEGQTGTVNVFLASRYNDEPYVGVSETRARPAGSSLRVGTGAATSVRANPTIEYRVFFIDGVGDAPSGPVEVAFFPLDDDGTVLPSAVSVWVDPAHHTLRSGPAVSVGLDGLSPRARGLYARFRAEYEPGTGLQPLLVWRESGDEAWAPLSDSRGAFEAGRFLVPLRDGFELRAYALDLGTLGRGL